MGSTAVVEVVPRVAQRWMGTNPTPTLALITMQRSIGDLTHGSLALKAYQQNLYLKYYY